MYNEGMQQITQYGVLIDHMVHLLEAYDLSLLEALKGDVLVCRFVSCQSNPPKRTSLS